MYECDSESVSEWVVFHARLDFCEGINQIKNDQTKYNESLKLYPRNLNICTEFKKISQ